jgi:hypothetical protein
MGIGSILPGYSKGAAVSGLLCYIFRLSEVELLDGKYFLIIISRLYELDSFLRSET